MKTPETKPAFWAFILTIILMACQPSSEQSSNFESATDMVASAKSQIVELTVEDFKSMMDEEEMYVLVDVRSKGEFESGYIAGAVNIPRGFLEFWINRESFWDGEGMYVPLKEDKLILSCRSGNRSALAALTLQNMGFENVYSLQGGWTAWQQAYPELTNSVVSQAAGTTPTEATSGQEEEDVGGC